MVLVPHFLSLCFEDGRTECLSVLHSLPIHGDALLNLHILDGIKLGKTAVQHRLHLILAIQIDSHLLPANRESNRREKLGKLSALVETVLYHQFRHHAQRHHFTVKILLLHVRQCRDANAQSVGAGYTSILKTKSTQHYTSHSGSEQTRIRLHNSLQVFVGLMTIHSVMLRNHVMFVMLDISIAFSPSLRMVLVQASAIANAVNLHA